MAGIWVTATFMTMQLLHSTQASGTEIGYIHSEGTVKPLPQRHLNQHNSYDCAATTVLLPPQATPQP